MDLTFNCYFYIHITVSLEAVLSVVSYKSQSYSFIYNTLGVLLLFLI